MLHELYHFGKTVTNAYNDFAFIKGIYLEHYALLFEMATYNNNLVLLSYASIKYFHIFYTFCVLL